MIGNLITLLILVATVALFVWLARRAWGSKRAWLKWLGVVLAGLGVLIFAVVIVVGALGLYRLYAPHNVPMPAVSIQATREQIARGEHLAIVTCVDCHSANRELPMSGGNNLSADTGLPLGDLYAPNITPAGSMKDWSDADLFRVIRTGVSKDGRATLMGVVGTRYLSDEDTLAVIGYLRNSPPTQNRTPEFNPSFLLSLLTGAGLVALDAPANVSKVTTPPKAANAEYGKYVFDFTGCADCHGAKLDGNLPPPSPPAPSIRIFVSNLAKENFAKVMRARASAIGSKAATAMPWKSTSRLDDVELEALFVYMHGIASK